MLFLMTSLVLCVFAWIHGKTRLNVSVTFAAHFWISGPIFGTSGRLTTSFLEQHSQKWNFPKMEQMTAVCQTDIAWETEWAHRQLAECINRLLRPERAMMAAHHHVNPSPTQFRQMPPVTTAMAANGDGPHRRCRAGGRSPGPPPFS